MQLIDRAVRASLTGLARLMAGHQVYWHAQIPTGKPIVFYANHSSHLDGVMVWTSLDAAWRGRTRIVAARDYWAANWSRRYVGNRVFPLTLIERAAPADEAAAKAQRAAIQQQLADVLATGRSLILFPEGTRGSGDTVQPFKSGLYHLSQSCPDAVLVPVWLRNLHRVLPKGEVLPVPTQSSIRFGAPLSRVPDEGKDAFLVRAREALLQESLLP
ncbi:MAG: lysophospholipid acyltransferase family protein [Pseudomonadota bacterium]